MNTLTTRPQFCGGDGGGEGIILHAMTPATGGAPIAGLRPSGGPPGQSTGDMLFPGAALDSLTTDALWLAAAPPVTAGMRTARLRTGSRRGLSLDRVRLLAVDHVAGTEAVAATDGRMLAGTRLALDAASNSLGGEVTARLNGLGPEPLYADSGEVITLSLPAADSTGDVLLLETSGGGPEEGGLVVESRTAGAAWAPLARIHPRRHAGTHAVPLQGDPELRLRFEAASIVRFAGRLVGASLASVATAPLFAAGASSGDQTDAARMLDGTDAVVPARNTLSLAFTDVAEAPGLARDWCLLLDGAPLAVEVAAARTRYVGPPPASAGPGFALLPNVPNPSSVLLSTTSPAGSWGGLTRLYTYTSQAVGFGWAGTEFLHTGDYLQAASGAAPYNYTDFLAGYLQTGSVSGIQISKVTWTGVINSFPAHQDFSLDLSLTGVGAGAVSPIHRSSVRARAGVIRAPGECATVLMVNSESVVLELLDVTGRVVRELFRQRLPKGATPVFWDLKDESGAAVRPGMFFLRLRSSSGEGMTRFAVLR